MQIEFATAWQGLPLHCGSTDIALTDLRFYVADVVLRDSAGVGYELLALPDSQWQQQGITLIDLENAAGSCLNGTIDMNTRILGTVEDRDFVSLQFTIGVPFNLNHADPLLAQAPLDDAAMHWHWRAGYKFLRAGVQTPTDSFWIHLGSTGCEGTAHNISGCRFPNRVTVDFPEYSLDSDRIVIELSELFRGVDFTDGQRSDCSSGPAERSCAQPFAALGIGINDDEIVLQQRVFRAQH